DLRIGAERLRRGLDRLLLLWSESAERMLDPIAKLSRDPVWHIARTLRHIINADAFGADQPGDALDLFEHGLGGAVEQQMRLVEQENQLRLVEIANLGQRLKQLVQHPQQKRRVEAGRVH